MISWVKGTLQSITQCGFRACSSVCECVCVCMSACRRRSQKLVAWLCSTLALALLCALLCCLPLLLLAGVFCVSVFCLPAAAATATACLLPPLPAACRMPPAAVSWHVVLALSLGFGLAGWHAGCSLLSRLPRSRRCDGSSNGSGGGASHFALLNFQFQL